MLAAMYFFCCCRICDQVCFFDFFVLINEPGAFFFLIQAQWLARQYCSWLKWISSWFFEDYPSNNPELASISFTIIYQVSFLHIADIQSFHGWHLNAYCEVISEWLSVYLTNCFSSSFLADRNRFSVFVYWRQFIATVLCCRAESPPIKAPTRGLFIMITAEKQHRTRTGNYLSDNKYWQTWWASCHIIHA